MIRLPLLFLLLISITSATGCGPAVDVEAEKIELLRIHLADIQAHRDGDVAVLMQTISEDFVSVADGRVDRPARDEIRNHFTAYLAGASYEAYEDLMVPHAEVSSDGTMGWVVSRIRVVRNEPDPAENMRTRDFTYAGIMTYAKVDGRWLKTANVSTFAP
jgi:ketosteroid isomerase-like protein